MAKATKLKLDYNIAYNKEHYKNYSLKFDLKKDAEVIEQLGKVKFKSTYIRQLIEDDIKRSKGETNMNMSINEATSAADKAMSEIFTSMCTGYASDAYKNDSNSSALREELIFAYRNGRTFAVKSFLDSFRIMCKNINDRGIVTKEAAERQLAEENKELFD